MAVTGWLFGLDHFVQNGYHWWPIVIGALFLIAYWALQGAALAGLADRVYRIRNLAGSLALGAVWSFASFMLFWYMLLPIARDGAPFRLTATAPGLFSSPQTGSGSWPSLSPASRPESATGHSALAPGPNRRRAPTSQQQAA